jgi:hypothetical protein
MSTTIVDMPKVTQMLDAGWVVKLYKGPMGSYEVRALHENNRIMRAALDKLAKQLSPEMKGMEDADWWDTDDDGWLMTDDFTPEQALTRMAYKVHGEVI